MAASSAGASNTPATYRRARLAPKRCAMKGLDLLERVAAEHRLGREYAAVGVIAVDQGRETLARDCLGRALLNRQIAQQARLHPRQRVLRQARVPHNLGNDPRRRGAAIAEDFVPIEAVSGPTDTDSSPPMPASSRASASAARALVPSSSIRPVRSASHTWSAALVQVAGVHDEPDRDLRHLSKRDQGDRKAVGQRERVGFGSVKFFGVPAGGRRLARCWAQAGAADGGEQQQDRARMRARAVRMRMVPRGSLRASVAGAAASRPA